MNSVTKKIALNLIGLDGNAFAILGAFHVRAKQEKWTEQEIEQVIAEATAGNYEQLLATIAKYCESPDNDEPS